MVNALFHEQNILKLFFFLGLHSWRAFGSRVDVRVLRFTLLFFNQCLLHCTWDMNSALRQMNSILWVWTITRNYFFIVFSLQQNKRYPNAPFIYVFAWVLIEVAFCITFCCSGSCSNYITLKTNCWLCLLQHRKPADDMLIGCSSRSPVGDGPASPKYSDRLSLAVNNYLSEASRQEVKSKLILLLKFWKSMFRCFFFFFFFLGNLLLQGI